MKTPRPPYVVLADNGVPLAMMLPLHLLRNLTVTKLQKLWLVTIFSLSGIVIAVALVRLVQVSQATNDSKQDLLAAVNGLLLLAMWSQIESMVAIIVATLPALRFIGKKRIIQERLRTAYGFGLVTIGGTGRSRPARPWQHEAESEDSVARQGSHAELGLARIKALTEGSESRLDRMASEHSTRPGTEPDGESQSVRRCI